MKGCWPAVNHTDYQDLLFGNPVVIRKPKKHLYYQITNLNPPMFYVVLSKDFSLS